MALLLQQHLEKSDWILINIIPYYVETDLSERWRHTIVRSTCVTGIRLSTIRCPMPLILLSGHPNILAMAMGTWRQVSLPIYRHIHPTAPETGRDSIVKSEAEETDGSLTKTKLTLFSVLLIVSPNLCRNQILKFRRLPRQRSHVRRWWREVVICRTSTALWQTQSSGSITFT